MKRELVGRQHGAAIRAIRKTARWGLADTAARIGIEPQSLTNIENNSVQASTAVMRKIAAEYGVPEEAITRDGLPLDEDEPVAAEVAA